MEKIIGFVVAAGHLDIEWYQPLRSYRFWTVEALEQLKAIAAERPDFASYVLDGQVYPLDEYLEVVPEDRQAMADLVRSGKLRIGPFYTQFDEWLPSAEAIIRNCLYGNRRAREFGACMQAGYLPDNFGHPRQLPQILRNFGLDSLLFMRGMPEIQADHPDEFIYEGLDGSRVMTSHFRETYCGAFDLFRKGIDPVQPREVPYYPDYLSYEFHLELAVHDDPERIARNLISNVERIKARYPSGIIPLISGFDHLPPQANIGDSVRKANELQDQILFVMGDVEEYVRLAQSRMRQPLIVRDELIGSVYQFVLLGALSTRTYIKQQQFAAEMLLEKYTEPLLALAEYHGYAAKPALLQEAWRNILINSAHDSIHGSSVDEVHIEMNARYAAVRQIAAGLIHETMGFIGRHIRRWWRAGGRGLAVYAPVSADDPQVVSLWLPVGDRPGSIVDEAGHRLPTQILPREPIDCNSQGQKRNSYFPDAVYRQVLFTDRLAGQQIKTYAWQDSTGPDGGQEQVSAGGDQAPEAIADAPTAGGEPILDNGLLRVQIKGALIDVTDKRTGKRYNNLNLLEEEADAGDAWDFSPPWIPGEVVRSTRFAFASQWAERGPVRQTVRISGKLSVPVSLNGDSRSGDRVDLPAVFEVSLLDRIPRVEVRLCLDNQARDHRIRLRVPTGIKTESVLSQNQLAVIRRPVEPAAATRPWRQPPTRLLPFREWLAVSDGEQGLALVVKGLYDYEAIQNPLTGEPDLCVTLVRGFAKMSRMNMMQRKDLAAWSHDTPGAQCLGRQVFEWAYVPFAAEAGNQAPFLPAADSYLAPPAAHAIRSTGQDARLTDFSRLVSGIGGHIRLSSLKSAYDGDGIILRFYENQGCDGQLGLDARGFSQVWLSDMNEQPLELLETAGQPLQVPIRAYQAVTLLLKPRQTFCGNDADAVIPAADAGEPAGRP